jgi:hypothetical protein
MRDARLRLALLATVLVTAVLSGCGAQVRAQDVFGDEPLATEDLAGLTVLDERWLDGDDGWLMGKPSYATASRTFSTRDGVTQESGVEAILSRAQETGWTRVGDQSSAGTSVASKELEGGDGRLLVSTTGVGPHQIVLTMSLQ